MRRLRKIKKNAVIPESRVWDWQYDNNGKPANLKGMSELGNILLDIRNELRTNQGV